MGCCEARVNSDYKYDLQLKNHYNSNNQNVRGNNKELLRLGTKPDIEYVKGSKNNIVNLEIPKTKEVKIPTVEVPLDVIKTKKRLSLNIFESKYLTEGTVLKINPGGLEGSERMARDGLVIFGTRNDEGINDFNFPEEDAIGKRHFEIKYDIQKDNYKIKNLFGSGLFVKITKKMILRNNSIFSFSTSHIVVKISMDTKFTDQATEATEGEVPNSILTLKVIHGINENQEYVYNSDKKTTIKIGRLQMSGIDVAFGEESTSRLQCTIFYENNNWYIVDGDGLKVSLNGTWYLADEYMDVYEGMIIRAGTTSFQAHLYDP